MKTSEIEAVGRTKVFTGKTKVYKGMSELNEYIEEVDVYTAEQMQEYAKECVREALKILDNAILPIFEDDERVVIQKIFEEDTKND